MPGPLLRARQGERIAVRLENGIEQDTALHWHGIRIDNAMDGVVGMTQPPVEPGAFFDYDFLVPDAGTYWYHAHQHSSEQVGRGLYGILVVDESESPDVDADHVLSLDDWRLDDSGAIHESFGNLHDISHGGRTGNWLTVNGRGNETLELGAGERVRLRLVNTANSLVMPLRLPDWPAWLMALDGMPLKFPVEVTGSLVLGPGQRADVFLERPADVLDADLAFLERDQEIPLVRFSHASARDRSPRMLPPEPLTPNPVEPCAEKADASTPLLMRGGAMGDLDRARYRGEMLDTRALIRLGKAWSLNGEVDRPGEPLLTAARGSTQEIVIENRTAWPHAMHLHGHHFELTDSLGGAGNPGSSPVLRDTVMIEARETLAVRFRADNPGDWLLHCHMLEHQAGGMVTWLRVS